MSAKKTWRRRIFRALAWGIPGVLALCAGTLVLLNNASVQKFWMERLLQKQGIEAHFDEIHFDFLISDKISLRGGNLIFPDGKRFRVEKFSARHSGTRGLFSGTPSFRDFSCEGFSADDERGRRLLNFSAQAKSLEASFLPWAPIEKFTLGSPLPWTFQAREFLISAQGKKIAEGTVSGNFVGAEPLSLFGDVRGDFAALLAQPFFSKINNVAAGTFALHGQGNSAQLFLEKLKSRHGEIEIPEIRFSAARERSAAGTLNIEIRGEEKSEASVHFSRLAFGNGQLIFSGNANAETLVVSDILRAALLFRGWNNVPNEQAKKTPPRHQERVPAQTPLPPTIAKKTADEPGKTVAAKTETPLAKTAPAAPENAFWNGVSGTMDFRAKRVVFPENEFGEHRGRFSVSDNALSATCSAPDFFDGTVTSEAKLTFSRNAPFYLLSGKISAAAVELHRAIPALRSRDPAPLEGSFNASVRISAAADLPEQLERSLAANFTLENVGPGRVRIFHADSKKMRLAGDILQIGGSLAGMLGGLTRNIEPKANALAQAAEFVKNFLTDFSYSEMRISGNYRSGEDLLCEHFELRGNDLKIFGSASARPLSEEPPELWPLRFSARTEVRGKLADSLRTLGVLPLSETPDAEGFFTAREFEFSGTLKKSSEDFFENLIDAAAGKNIRAEEDSRVPVENLLDIFTR
ncbi:MAG: hypothetical protein IJF68_02755 [Opitutales bacterium]|nr:hypothetical protein [Opitutales bacterium]